MTKTETKRAATSLAVISYLAAADKAASARDLDRADDYRAAAAELARVPRSMVTDLLYRRYQARIR